MFAVHLQICTRVVHKSQARGTASYVCLAGRRLHALVTTTARLCNVLRQVTRKQRRKHVWRACLPHLPPAPPPCRAVALGERVDLATCQLITHLRRSNLHPNLHTPHKLAKSRYLQPSPFASYLSNLSLVTAGASSFKPSSLSTPPDFPIALPSVAPHAFPSNSPSPSASLGRQCA